MRDYCVIVYLNSEIYRELRDSGEQYPFSKRDIKRSYEGQSLWETIGTRDPSSCFDTSEENGMYFYLDHCYWSSDWGPFGEVNNEQHINAFICSISEYLTKYDVNFERFESARHFELTSYMSTILVLSLSNLKLIDSTESLNFVAKYQNNICNTKILNLISKKDFIKLNSKLDEYRMIRNYDKLDLILAQPYQKTLPISNDKNSLKLCVGSAATLDAGSFLQDILLPVSDTGWISSKTRRHSKMLGRKFLFLNKAVPLAELGLHTVWIFPTLTLIKPMAFCYALNFCLNALISFEQNDFTKFNNLYSKEVINAETGIWEEAFAQSGPDITKVFKTKLKEVKEQIKYLLKDLEFKYRTTEQHEHSLKHSELGDVEWRKKGREQYKLLSELPMVESCRFSGTEFKITTYHLHMLNPDNDKYFSLGCMEFTFQPLNASSTLKIKNLTRIHSGYWDRCAHPHIQQNSNGCQGTLKSSLAELFGSGEYAAGVEQIILFLQTVNLDDPAGALIVNWPLSDGIFPDGKYIKGVKQS